MFDVSTETFLFEFFLCDTIVGKFTDNKKLFDAFRDIWNIPSDVADELYVWTERESVRDISSESDYMRYKRIKQYNELINNPPIYSRIEDLMIALKGDAIKTANRYGLFTSCDATKVVAKKSLISCAQNGNIIALRMLGIIQCEGIEEKQDLESGLKYLKKAMRWGDITSTLAVLKYSAQDRLDALKILNTNVKNTVYGFLAQTIQKKFGIYTNESNEEVLLVLKACDTQKIRHDEYHSMYARLIFSPVISVKDKEKVLFSERKELLSETCDLPLRLANQNVNITKLPLIEMPIQRISEQNNVTFGLMNSDLKGTDSYRPICLCSESDYVLDTYKFAIIQAISGANVECIDVADLQKYDIEPNKNNVFLRCLNENSANVWVLVFKGEINDTVMDFAKGILRGNRRSRFRLNHPPVTIDLSSVLPICICDKNNAKKLQGLVEFIYLAPLNEKEKSQIIKELILRKGELYKTKETTIEKGVIDTLLPIPIETTARIFDKIIRENRFNKEGVCLTVEMLKPYMEKKMYGESTYGFGGFINENK